MTEPYAAYAPRALEWVPELPISWRVASIGREVWVRARLGWRGLTADEYVEDGIPMLATPNIKGSEIDFESANKISVERYEESAEIMLRVGDVLLTKDGSTIGTVNVVRALPEPATVNGSIAVLTPSGALSGRFLYWFIASAYAQSTFDRLRGGMGIPHLFQADINRIRFPMPPPVEQRAIADFLDRETGQIDTLIAKQEALIATLRERRASTVAATLRSSTGDGTRLKHVASIQSGVTLGGEAKPGDPEWPYLRVANVQVGFIDLSEVKTMQLPEEQAAAAMLRAGDVLMTEGGDIDKLGRGAIWAGEISPALHQNHIFAVRPGQRLIPEYLVYLAGWALRSLLLPDDSEEDDESRCHEQMDARQLAPRVSATRRATPHCRPPRRADHQDRHPDRQS